MSAVLSYRYRLLQSVCLPSPAWSTCATARWLRLPAFTGYQAPLLGFLSLQRMSARGVRFTWAYLTQQVPLSRFRTSAAVYSSLRLSGLFHPETLLGFALQSLPFRVSRTPLGAFPLLRLSCVPIHGYGRQRPSVRTQNRC